MGLYQNRKNWEGVRAGLLASPPGSSEYNRGLRMPAFHVWNHELHLMLVQEGYPEMKDCNAGCEIPGEKSKSVGLIDKLKSKLRIEDVAGRLTRLHGAGTRLKGKCPLHREVNGEAFAVWMDSQTWRCFGQCVAGGDVLDFIKECKDRGIEWRVTDGKP